MTGRIELQKIVRARASSQCSLVAGSRRLQLVGVYAEVSGRVTKRLYTFIMTVIRNHTIHTNSGVAAAEEELLHLGLAGCKLVHQVRLELHNLVKVGADSKITF